MTSQFTNVLVRHKQKPSLGIGCISRVLKHTVVVNWGLHYASKHLPSVLETVDVSECKTITFSEFKKIGMESDPSLHLIIVGNELKSFVGIGWVTDRVINADDLKTYKRVIH